METELEKGGRCGGRGEKGELIYSKEENNPIQVTAMVERVVKRQAELGVDIVTDGEVVSLDGIISLCPGGERRLLHALSEARCAGD